MTRLPKRSFQRTSRRFHFPERLRYDSHQSQAEKRLPSQLSFCLPFWALAPASLPSLQESWQYQA